MKIKQLTAVTLIGLATTFSCVEPTKELKIETESQKVAYGLGITIAKDIQNNKLDSILETQYILEGLKHALDTTGSTLISETEAQAALNEFFQKLNDDRKKTELKKFEKNIEAGNKYMEEYKKDEKVQVTESGLQYKILQNGRGEKPTVNDVVKVHYKGSLIDGRVFDSSYDRGEPVEFGVTQVISGWTEALQLMTVGSKWEIVIPQELAYGENPRPNGMIEPYSTLVFEVELLEIIKK